MKTEYAVAWNCLLVCLRNGYSLDCWICPIPDEHRAKMLEAGKIYVERERLSKREPFLFDEEDLNVG